jgi:hypothetical protein
MRCRRIFLTLGWLALLGLAGCAARTQVDGATIYSNPLWVGVVWMAVGVVGALVGIAVMLGVGGTSPTQGQDGEAAPEGPRSRPDGDARKQTFSRVGRVLTGLGIVALAFFLGVDGAINRMLEKVAVSDAEFVSEVGVWYNPQRDHFTFEEVRSIRTRQEESGSGRNRSVRRYADFELNSGRQETISVDNNVLRWAWPEIAQKASARGVQVSGDAFTE